MMPNPNSNPNVPPASATESGGADPRLHETDAAPLKLSTEGQNEQISMPPQEVEEAIALTLDDLDDSIMGIEDAT